MQAENNSGLGRYSYFYFMNVQLSRLSSLYQKESRLIIGLMSGTSLDGLDIALCRISGAGFSSKVELMQFESIPFEDDFKSDVRTVFSKKQVDLEKLALLNALIAQVHAEMILSCLNKWQVSVDEVDCIASHGQTIYHAPQRLHGLAGYPNATLQIGDGDHLAIKTGIVTLSDFRQKHVAAGGEGAPLALYGDCILFSSADENRLLLNIGGISNFTFLPSKDVNAKVLCTDIGPGNTLIDALAKKYFNKPYDENGSIARQGKINEVLLDALMDNAFFNQALPKTTGPELFNLAYLDEATRIAGIGLSPEDLLATLTAFTARGITKGIQKASLPDDLSIYISGGGAHNSYLTEKIREFLPKAEVKNIADLGVNPDAKEAILFALLANETICGSAIETGGGPVVMMGKICLPV